MVKKEYVLIGINILLSINEHRGQKKYTPIKKISTVYLLSNNPTSKREKKNQIRDKMPNKVTKQWFDGCPMGWQLIFYWYFSLSIPPEL